MQALALVFALLIGASAAHAQQPPAAAEPPALPPPQAAPAPEPQPAPPPQQPAPPPQQQPSPPPQQQPAPPQQQFQQQPPPQQYQQQPPPQQYQQQPPPPQYQQQPPPQQYQQQPPPQQYQQQPPPQQPQYEGQYQGAYGSDYPEPRGADDDDDGSGDGDGWSPTGFSVRIDPLNWIIEGRLGFELELGIWEFLTFELVPIFVVDTEPLTLNFSGFDDEVSQHSNGLGPISGASFGLGFWLSGEPFKGYVLRANLTNYGYRYESHDSAGTLIDEVEHTERRFVGFIGSYSRFGFFTIGGGLGIGYALNQQERCGLVGDSNGAIGGRTSGCDGELRIAIGRTGNTVNKVADLNGFLHPVYIEARFSLGVAFD